MCKYKIASEPRKKAKGIPGEKKKKKKKKAKGNKGNQPAQIPSNPSSSCGDTLNVTLDFRFCCS